MQTAAFYRAEGTLLTRPTSLTPAWLAANAQGLGERLGRFGALALSAPLALSDASTGRRLAWSSLRGMSEDRLVVLGEEYFETWLRPNLASVGLDLLRRSRDAGHRIVLLSDNLDVVVQPLARHLELDLDDVVCNRMELRGGRATGRLADPVVLPHVAGQWARDFAERRDIDLSISCGYGSAGADSTLLSAIGRPCAVEPDRSLRQIARDLQWPIVRG